MKYRLDALLTQKRLFESRNKAAVAICEGRIKVNGVLIQKSSFITDEEAEIFILAGDNFVSRAYKKLSAALDKFKVDVSGIVAIDIGASTGGFTQCLLERGAKKVYAIDVGIGQLHKSLKNDSRVISMDSTNARNLRKEDFPEVISLAVMDVSFISQSKIYPAVSDILPAGSLLISLIKPQFEVGKNNIGKHGIVKDKDGKLIASVNNMLGEFASQFGLFQKDFTVSPITGSNGNKEYLSLFKKEH